MKAFQDGSTEVFRQRYPAGHASLRHSLTDHPLLTLDRLLALSKTLPEAAIEYNAGDLPVSQDPAKTPMNGLDVEETIRRIAENESWLVLKNIEQDEVYASLLEETLSDLADAIQRGTGEMFKREAFVFISSPGAVTPFHMDPEHNILMQIRGSKIFHLFSAPMGAIVSEEQHEAFYADEGHRNLPYRDEFKTYEKMIEMEPGDALYVPVKTPHWVAVGPEVSVSLSVTWRSRASDREAHLRQANRWLRAHGFSPPPAGQSPVRDGVAALGARAAARFRR
ncbi:MAG: cupin-like domain-containing protein [Pseudomonadota bacterium]